MNTTSPLGRPSALAGAHSGPDTPVPYAFERVQRDSDGGEVARLEAQNLLFEKARPLDQLPPTPRDGAILDLGSGTGFWSARLAARVPEGTITCLDRSEELLALARTRLDAPGGPRAAFLHQDLRALDLPERAYDLVFTSMTLAHVRELGEVLARLVRALKPGGWIASFEPVHQAQRLSDLHPPCPNLEFLMDRLLDVAEGRGSDLSVGLKIAHHLERLGLQDTELRDYGSAMHGEDARVCIREVFLPLAWAYLRHRWEPGLLERRMEAAAREVPAPHLWLDFRRAVVLGRRPA